MTTFLYVLLAIVVLLFMVMVHELGHYIAGKILKFKIDEFSIGFGKAIFSHTSKKTGEKFSLRIFPLGGYCSFYGEEDDGKAISADVVEVKDKPFNEQKPWKRIIVFLAGVTMNFLTAILFSWILLCSVGYDVPQIVDYSTTVNVNESGESIFQKNDVITHINGKKIDFAFGVNFVDAVNNVKSSAKEFYERETYDFDTDGYYTFSMTVRRDGERVEFPSVKVVQEIVPPQEEGGEETYRYLIGLENDNKVCTTAYRYGFFEGLGRSFSMAFGFAWVVLKSLWMLITFQIPITEMGGAYHLSNTNHRNGRNCHHNRHNGGVYEGESSEPPDFHTSHFGEPCRVQFVAVPSA